MSTTGKEMIVETTLMDNTAETTARNSVESTAETITDETEVSLITRPVNFISFAPTESFDIHNPKQCLNLALI